MANADAGTDGALAAQADAPDEDGSADAELLAQVQQAQARRISYVDVEVGPVTAKLRLSKVPRRHRVAVATDPLNRVLDLDIIQITVEGKRNRRRGHATAFLLAVRRVAAQIQRGVYLENCLTEDSRAWAAALVARGLLVRAPPCSSYDEMSDSSPCFLCPLTA
jgi:hypothetical protein